DVQQQWHACGSRTAVRKSCDESCEFVRESRQQRQQPIYEQQRVAASHRLADSVVATIASRAHSSKTIVSRAHSSVFGVGFPD
ncbi:hypothetical protein Dimus_011240, partial [Dionaea muscipula]